MCVVLELLWAAGAARGGRRAVRMLYVNMSVCVYCVYVCMCVCVCRTRIAVGCRCSARWKKSGADVICEHVCVCVYCVYVCVSY